MDAAAADALYALAGALATAFVLRILAATWVMELIGAAVLAWLAVRTWTQHSKNREQGGASGVRVGLLRSFGETLFLTLANPATILSFAAVSATQGFGTGAHAYVFAVGVFIGSAAWWLLLATGVRFASRRLSPRAFQSIHIASGVVLATFAVLAFAKALSDFR